MLSITRIEMISKSRSPFHSLLAGALTLAISGIAAVAGAFIFIYFGIYDVSVASAQNPLVVWGLAAHRVSLQGARHQCARLRGAHVRERRKMNRRQ
jgi:hypothetical protein